MASNKIEGFEVMRAKNYDPKRVVDWKRMYLEPKLDGIRVIAFMSEAGRVSYYSRNGRQLLMFTHLDDDIKALSKYIAKYRDARFNGGVMLDGEMTSKTKKFGDISGAIHRKDYVATDARFTIFHAMPSSRFERGIDDRSQIMRHEVLLSIFESHEFDFITHSEAQRAKSDEHVREMYDWYLKRKCEGLMVKDMHEPWIAKRTFAWMKLKEEDTIDVVVTKVKEGAGKYKRNCGSLIVDYKGKEVPVSGMTDAQRRKFWRRPHEIIGKVIEVLFQKETVHGAMRHARFKRIRLDKESP